LWYQVSGIKYQVAGREPTLVVSGIKR